MLCHIPFFSPWRILRHLIIAAPILLVILGLAAIITYFGRRKQNMP
jgi:hypothetical protein